MKARTILIIIGVSAAAAGGGIYAARYFAGASRSPIKVVPVSSINYGNWWGDMGASTSGEVVAVDSQKVTLSNEYALKKVYVETGDTVKAGDLLLEYDMTLPELQQEMEQLNHQLLEITLDSQQKALAKLNGGSLPTALLETEGEEEKTRSGEDDGIEMEDAGTVSDSAESTMTATATDAQSDQGNEGAQTSPQETAPPTTDDNGNSGSETGNGGAAGDQEELIDGGDGTGESENTGDDTPSGEGVIEGEDDGLIEDEDLITGNSEETDALDGFDEAALLGDVESFLHNVSLMQQQEETGVRYDYISEGMTLFEKKLGAAQTVTYQNLLAETQEMEIYTLSEQVKASSVIGADTRSYLYQGYARTLYDNFIFCLNQLKELIPEGRQVSELSDAEVRALEQPIRSALAAYDKFRLSTDWYGTAEDGTLKEPETGLGDFINALKTSLVQPHLETDQPFPALIARLRALGVVTETETESEIESEAVSEADPGFGGYDGGGLDSGDTMTAEERAEAIKTQVIAIKETKLQMRESDLKLKKYDRIVHGGREVAQMDGVVTAAGTLDGGGSDDGFIVIAGATGMMVEGSISELLLDTVLPGDTISISSWEYGYNCTAVITEISQYPMEGTYYASWGQNSNASQYPFYAYIEDTMDVQEGYVEITFEQAKDTSGIYLSEAFIRTDTSGKSYVYVQGKDGLLEKRYVKTAMSDGGYSVRIRSGLSEDDRIAFPYGKYVEEGAQTIEVESLEEDMYS